jgi:hypothetical protein
MNFHLWNLALTSFYLKPFIIENEESKFLSLRFVGNGKLQSLIAIFGNGKIFGIADFSVETICHLALNDPSALSTAIKKLKFLKCNVDGDFPFIKALIYDTPTLKKGMSKEIEHDDFNGGILLSIIVIDSKGFLSQGSIGTTALLQNNPLTKICYDLLTKRDHSVLCYPIPIQSLYKECLDIAIKPSVITDLVTEDLNNTNIVIPMIAIALYIDSSIVILNLSDNSISKVIYLNMSSPLKILLIRNMSYPKERNTEGFDICLGDASVIGIQSKSTEINAISLFALLNDKDDSQYYTYQLSSNMIPTNHTFNFLNLSIPGDLFLTIESYTGGNSVLSVLEISDDVDSCIYGIITGLLLNDDNVKRNNPNHINEEISASILIGKIQMILFTLIESSGDEEEQSNPFREQVYFPLSACPVVK